MTAHADDRDNFIVLLGRPDEVGENVRFGNRLVAEFFKNMASNRAYIGVIKDKGCWQVDFNYPTQLVTQLHSRKRIKAELFKGTVRSNGIR